MVSVLHRSARAKEYSFIATAPIGIPDLSGIVVIGEAKKQPSAYILRLTQLIAGSDHNPDASARSAEIPG